MGGSIGKKVVIVAGSSFGPIKRMKGEIKLMVFGIHDVATKMQGGCSKGKILSKYLSWDNGKFSYKCLQVNLVDHEGFQTITLMISKAFVLHHLDKICIGKYIKIINSIVVQNPSTITETIYMSLTHVFINTRYFLSFPPSHIVITI